MYDELIRQMRACCNGEPCEEANCGFNPKSDLDCIEQLLTKAVDAIEELSEQLENETEYATALNSYVPHWIPVTERLPENGVTVLAYYNNFMTEAFYANNQWHELATYAIIPTTYWMQRPEPPKEET